MQLMLLALQVCFLRHLADLEVAFADQEIESSIIGDFMDSIAKYKRMFDRRAVNFGAFRNTRAGLIASEPSDSAASKCYK